MENEHAILGALLKTPTELNNIDLVPSDFAIESYRMAYQVIIDMFAASEVIDVLTVADRMARANPMGDNYWLVFLGRAAKDCISTANLPSYANLVKDASRIRQAKVIAHELTSTIDTCESASDSVDAAVSKLMALSSETRKTYECTLSQAMFGAIESIEDSIESNGTVGTPTGITKLDEILSGFHDSDLIVVAGRPAMGKTAVLLNFLNSAKAPTGLISSEQPADQIGVRMLAIGGSVNSSKMRNGKINKKENEHEYNKISVALERINREANVWINDKSGISILDVIRQARKWRHLHKIEALYIDYIQRIKWTDQRLAKWEQVGNVVMALKELARELQIPVIALAQVSRNVEQKSNRRPGMGDLANSGEIEKEADVILTLYRDEEYNDQSEDKGLMEINILKNRHGPTGFIKVAWLAEYMQIKDIYKGESY